MQERGLVIESVEEESIARELELEPGDAVCCINGHAVRDILDYRYLADDASIQVTVRKKNGEVWLLDIDKDPGEQLGISFRDGGWDRTITCGNKCIFCFVDQMPPCMRPSLYVKDDDYRLSFVQGNFITLTNAGPADLKRIAAMRLSPLYISVHTTNPELRRFMMGHPRAGRIMEQLRFLADAGIQMHTQIVLCPGINDGPELDRTINDLGSLWPSVRSLAVVPVGLTAYRQGLTPLRTYSRDEARVVLDKVHGWQSRFLSLFSYPLVFAGDEFYLLAGYPLPPANMYGGFPQTENGVGIVRLFLDEWRQARGHLPARVNPERYYALVTGKLAGPVLETVVEELNRIPGLQVELFVLENKFFGQTVTVAGLLTGRDLLEGLAGRWLGDKVFIPSVMLQEGRELFLDDLTLQQVSGRLQVPLVAVRGPEELVGEMVR